MARTIRQGFTLVEMLVVITIIGMLVALLIPAALGVQGAARRAVCMNNLKELTTACLKYESKFSKMPPSIYYETFAPAASSDGTEPLMAVGWVVTILEDLGKGELGGLFRDKKLAVPALTSIAPAGGSMTPGQVAVQARSTLGFSYISQLVCPANPPTSLARASLSYVCNSGIYDEWLGNTRPTFGLTELRDFKENGVFMIQHVNSNPARTDIAPTDRVTSSFIAEHDGTSQTLLLSENVNASVWAVDTSPVDTPNAAVRAYVSAPREFEQGMNWSRAGAVVVGLADQTVSDPNEDIYYTVADGAVGIKDPTPRSARPSSLHGGGYNVAFCSGNVMWLSNQMDKSIYPLLLTPWGARARYYQAGVPSGGVSPQLRGPLPVLINEVELAK